MRNAQTPISLKSLTFGIIGCGRIAETHAQQMSQRGTIAGVCDIDIDNANRLAGRYHTVAYYNIKDFLQKNTDLDIVSVCTPNGLHCQHVLEVLRHKVHVLCEKPMALTVADCQAMIDAAKIADKELFIVKQNRYNPPVQALKKAIDEGRLGKIFSLQLSCFWNRSPAYYDSSWRGTKNLDGGTLFTQFSHFIDLLYWMFGDVKNIGGFIGNFNHRGMIEFEDTGTISLEFDQGVIGTLNYTVNSFQKNMEGSLTVFGEKGTVKIGGQYLNLLEYQSFEQYTLPESPVSNSANQYVGYQGSMSNHDKVFDNVVDVITKDGIMMTSAFDGLKTVEIINRIYNSAFVVN
jgi:UDP-N-acetyl-2-amino-2-deoxyglucuronate dehydrogenase